ncbi:MAG: iron-binding protein [Peptococcaceae bacterium]|nr:iron-binding protein [Peptococcaceae bacterium]
MKMRSIKIIKNGPYIVKGNVPLSEKIILPKGKGYELKNGRELPQREVYSLCRCGKSQNPPFCDGNHEKINFDGTETASREKYMDRVVDTVRGPELTLLDDGRCAYARFCHRNTGDIWGLTKSSDNPLYREEAVIAATECPSGRFIITDKNGQEIPWNHEPSIEILQDPEKKVSGPITVKGKIPVESSDGFTYELRDQLTLCRCGKSRNTPFCDAAHASTRFSDRE